MPGECTVGTQEMLFHPTLFHSPFIFSPLCSSLTGHRARSIKMRLVNEKTPNRTWGPTGMSLGLVTEVGRGAKVPLKSPWRLVFLPLLGESWSWGSFRLLLIGLSVYKALSHTLLHSIGTITEGSYYFPHLQRSQLKLTMVKKWAHKLRVKRQSLNLNPCDLASLLEQFRYSHAVSWK